MREKTSRKMECPGISSMTEQGNIFYIFQESTDDCLFSLNEHENQKVLQSTTSPGQPLHSQEVDNMAMTRHKLFKRKEKKKKKGPNGN